MSNLIFKEMKETNYKFSTSMSIFISQKLQEEVNMRFIENKNINISPQQFEQISE